MKKNWPNLVLALVVGFGIAGLIWFFSDTQTIDPRSYAERLLQFNLPVDAEVRQRGQLGYGGTGEVNILIGLDTQGLNQVFEAVRKQQGWTQNQLDQWVTRRALPDGGHLFATFDPQIKRLSLRVTFDRNDDTTAPGFDSDPGMSPDPGTAP